MGGGVQGGGSGCGGVGVEVVEVRRVVDGGSGEGDAGSERGGAGV